MGVAARRLDDLLRVPGLSGADSNVLARRVVAGGVDTAVAERLGAPGAPVVVLVPGGALDTTALTWSEVLRRLPAAWRIVVPDLPGYGASGPPTGPTTADGALWLAAFVETLGVERLVLAASSKGAAFALTMALDRPGRLAGIVVSGAYGLRRFVPLHPLAALVVRLRGLARMARTALRRRAVLATALGLVAVYDRAALTDDLVDDALAGLAPPDALDAFAAWLRTEIRPGGCATDLRTRLPSLAVPALVVHGRHDRVLSYGPAVAAARRIPDARLVSLPGGHLGPREAPEIVTARVRAFVESVW